MDGLSGATITSVGVARLMRFGKQPVQFSGSYEYNFADDYPSPAWSVSFTVKLLFPVGG